MSTFFVDPASLERAVTWLAWVLLNTVWQGAVIAIALWAILGIVPVRRSNIRYGLACTALIAMALAPIGSGFVLRHQLRAEPLNVGAVQPAWAKDQPAVAEVNRSKTTHTGLVQTERPPLIEEPTAAEPTVVAAAPQAAHSVAWTWLSDLFRSSVDRYAGFLDAVWLLGVAISAGRLLSSFQAVRALRRSATTIDDAALLNAFAELLRRLNLNPGICLMQSTAVRVPTALGWLRPVVLFPVSYASGLSLDQVEALLAHELGHIKRHDYLINLLQSVIETVLFYHPAVWWISSVIRDEREHCCDAIALRLVSNRGLYASALVELATLATTEPQLAMSAGGGSLKARLERILNIPASASATSGPVIALTLAFLLTLFATATRLSQAGADDAKNEKPAATTDIAETDSPEETPSVQLAQAGAKAANDAAEKADKPSESNAQFRRGGHGDGFGGGETFRVLNFEIVQKELGLSDDIVAKAKAIAGEYHKEVSEFPSYVEHARTVYRDRGSIVTLKEATSEGLPMFKAAVAKYRPKLKEILTPEQYRRLQQIAWQDMSTSAFADDELIAALNITKEQQDKLSAVKEEYRNKRRELNQLAEGGSVRRERFRKMMDLRQEESAKITESLPKELRDRFSELKGKDFDTTQFRRLGRRSRRDFGADRGSRLLELANFEPVQKDLGVAVDQAGKIKAQDEEFQAAMIEPENERRDDQKPSEEEQKIAKEKRKKIAESNKATADKFVAKLKELLTAEQFNRLQQIYWQNLSTPDSQLTDPEMIKVLPVSNELQETIKTIHKEYDSQIQKIRQEDMGSRNSQADMDKEQDAKMLEVLSKAQQEQLATLLGKELDLTQAKVDRARESNNQLRTTETQSRFPPMPRGGFSRPRRFFISLIEREGVQKELGINADQAAKIKSLGEEIRTAVRQVLGDPPDFAKISEEESNKVVAKIRKTDDEMTEKFLPKLKAILTPDQFARFKQIYWQSGPGTALQDPEVIETLAVTKAQQDQLKAIHDEAIRDMDRRNGVVHRADINTIYSWVQSRVDPNERRTLGEQYRGKQNEVLTKEQQEQLEKLKGKEFDLRRLDG